MSLSIYAAHTGIKLDYDARSSIGLEDIQTWIAETTAISTVDQILLNSRGKGLKQQSLHHESEVFLYDKRVLTATTATSTSSLVPKTPLPAPADVRDPPQPSAQDKSLEAWKTLFKDRRVWSLGVAETAGGIVDKIKATDAEAIIVQRSGAIAVENIKLHIGNLRPRYEEVKTWAESVRNDHEFLLENHEQDLGKFKQLPVIEKLGNCLHGAPNSRNNILKTWNGELALEAYVDAESTVTAWKTASNAAQQFAQQLEDLENLFEDTAHNVFEASDNFGQDMASSDSDVRDQARHLMEEIEVIARKIDGDYNHVLNLSDSDKSLKEMARTALLHTRNFLPTLQQTNADIDQLYYHTVERKNNVVSIAIRYLQRVSMIESMIQQIRVQLANLDVTGTGTEAFETLNSVMKLPSTYGMLLIECVRRREWADKMMSDSSVLVEEIAIFKDEETRRRKKWIKDMGDVVDMTFIDNMVFGIDVHLKTEKEMWPDVNRNSIEDFVRALQKAGGFEDVIKEMELITKSLDAPTKRQTKAFTNSSIHGANRGQQSLLFHRDNEEIRLLQSEKSKLEERLKSSDSRIRRLEDIMHRQSLTSRPPSNHAWAPNLGVEPYRHDASPASRSSTPQPAPHELPSRTSSISARKKTPANDTGGASSEERVMALETELANLQQQVAANAENEASLRGQVHDAVSTKEDLLSNMEAQQREFEAERRLVEEDNSRLKIKLEEFEDEMDRMIESREQDSRVHQLEKELEKVRNDCASEVQKAQGQVDYIRNDYTIQREKAHQSETQIKELDEEVASLSLRVQKRDMSAATNHRALRTVMLRLSKDSVAPEGLDALVETVEELAKQNQEHLTELEKSLKGMRVDNIALETRTRSQADEIHNLKDKVGAGDTEASSLREEMAKLRADIASLEAELDTERREHGTLSSKFAAGETDAESLRKLVAMKEEEIANLNGKLASLEADKERVEGVAAEFEIKFSEAQATLDKKKLEEQAKDQDMENLRKAHDALASDLKSRSEQAEDVSAQLYGHKNTMGRLLEQVGYTVIKQGDALAFQRASKAATSSSVLADTANSMTRSVSGPGPTVSLFDNATSSSLTHWPSSPTSSLSADFANFMADIKSLPPEAFSDAIIKRVRDADHTSRKYVKEARNYRDKYRRVQSEVHDKITIRAFKEGDLVLFLPTRNQATGAWAAFNVGYPHYFLREQESHRLPGRDWLLARISKIESRVVDLSKSINGLRPPQGLAIVGGDAASDGGVSFDDENPFELSDGLRWYLMDATEEKLGPPMTIGLGKSTVAAANVDAQGSMGNKKNGNLDGEGEATVKLRGSLDVSRRSSSNSKVGVPVVMTSGNMRPGTATSLEERLANGRGPIEDSEHSAADQTRKRQSALRHSSSQEPAEPAKGAKVSPSKPPPYSVAAVPSKPSPSKQQSAPSSRKTSPEKPKSKAWDSLWSLDYSLESRGR